MLSAPADRGGVTTALVEAIAYALPSPYGEQLSFTAEFVERAAGAPVGWPTLLTLYRHGFLPKSSIMYDFDTHGIDAYLSDLAESEYGWAINEPAQEFLNDKAKFYDLLDDRGFGGLLPIQYGTLEGAFSSARAATSGHCWRRGGARGERSNRGDGRQRSYLPV